MAQLIYYVAVSLDGFIAPEDGSIDWLQSFSNGEEDYGFEEFYLGVDALIQGSKTYEQVLTFGKWPYPGKPNWVFTSRKLKSEYPEVQFTSLPPPELMNHISSLGHKRVWLIGGSQLAGSFHSAGLITEYVFSVIPVILGAGKPLFGAHSPPEQLKLVKCTCYPSGLVQMNYIP